jgi:hypothetical protein
MMARAENWASGVEIPLQSGPFAAELPSVRPPDYEPPPPDVVPADVPALLMPSPVAPATASATPRAAALAEAPRAGSSRWWVIALLVLGLAVYLALRPS